MWQRGANRAERRRVPRAARPAPRAVVFKRAPPPPAAAVASQVETAPAPPSASSNNGSGAAGGGEEIYIGFAKGDTAPRLASHEEGGRGCRQQRGLPRA
jgi:hypothetical protein